jgi:hypothetical protein
MPLRVPTPQEYAAMPYVERMRAYAALKRLLGHWAMVELEQLREQKAAEA